VADAFVVSASTLQPCEGPVSDISGKGGLECEGVGKKPIFPKFGMQMHLCLNGNQF
jgi:hypothetical protein